MNHEHDDDMTAEVGEGANGEADQYAVVAEDIEDRDADAIETDRLRDLRNHLRQAEDDQADEG